MSDLANSVIIPRDDFYELELAAYQATPLTQRERTLGMVRGTVLSFAVAGAVTCGSWGIAKAQDWLEQRRLERKMFARKHHIDN